MYRDKLSESDMKWILDHFSDTKNSDIVGKLSISLTTLHTFARNHGLRKSDEFMRMSRVNAARRSAEAYYQLNTEEFERRRNKKREIMMRVRRNCFGDNGRTLWNTISEERANEIKRKIHTMVEERRSIDRARLRAGLKPKTKLKLGIPSKERTYMYQCKRLLTKKYGYICPKVGLTIYYDDNTKRTRMEHIYEKRRGFRFVHINDVEESKRVIVVPDWSDNNGGITRSYIGL